MTFDAVLRVREGLAELIRLINSGGASTADARLVLSESKAFAAQVAVLQADAAALVAAGERHGDGGAGVLAQAAGLSRRDAAGQVKAVERLQSMPDVRDALTEGEISLANAKTLAQASEKVSAAQVARDGDLLEKAASLSPEQFSREAGRWVAQRQDDGGEGEYRRQRARRRLNIWNGDDGMVHLRGELDPVAGAKMRTRLLKEAERLRRSDVGNPGGEQRTLPQRLADALDTPTAPSGSADGRGSRPSTDITIVQHLSPEGDKAFAEIADGGVIPQIVLEEQFCNARIVGVVFSSKGLPLWRGPALPRPSKAQMDALIARYGGCGGCGEHSTMCQAHHIRPRSQGGPTDIDNLMPLCWGCHDKVHYYDWQVVPDGDLHTIAPPERIRYGPAHAPDPPPIHSPPHPRRDRGSPGRQRAPSRSRLSRSSRSPKGRLMTWRDAAKRVEAGIATMLAWVTGGGVTAEEMLKAADQAAADMAEMVALTNVECASSEELHDVGQTCRAISARLAVFDERAKVILATMRNEGNGDAAVA